MVNIKKQIINTRITSFLQKHELILFYHYNSTNTKHWNGLKMEIRKGNSVDILMAKNKIACKAIILTANLSEDGSPFCSLSGFTPLGMLEDSKLEKDHSNKTMTLQKNKIFAECFSIFQGPTLLIGCKSIKQFSVLIQFLNSENSFLLLGAFYQKQIVNHLQIRRLANLLIMGDQVYTALLQKMYNPLKAIILIKKHFNFFFFCYYQQKLIYILRNLNAVQIVFRKSTR